MSLNTFWKTRKPIKREAPRFGDCFHAYITKFKRYDSDEDVEGTTMLAFYGELKVCDNLISRRSPIATQDVIEVVLREPYEHCPECMTSVDWLEHMGFGKVVRV